MENVFSHTSGAGPKIHFLSHAQLSVAVLLSVIADVYF